MDIIIPCAGQSTRFPNMRPKYLLSDYSGRCMIQLAADQYLADNTVHIVILQKHEDQYNSTRQLRSMFGSAVNIVTLPNPTSGPAETINQALDILSLPKNSGFLVKDCDSIFEHSKLSPGNKVFTDILDKHPDMRQPGNKSYVLVNDWGIISGIVEKKIVSDVFCVGGYQFENVDLYRDAYNEIKHSRLGEIFISSVIDHLITKGAIFTIKKVQSYVDLGTVEDWNRHNDKPTLFVDIDGCIVKNQGLHSGNNYLTEPTILEHNVAVLLRAMHKGAQIVFTTSRPKRFEPETKEVLRKLGFINYQILMDMHHARRILVNDYAPSNPWPSALAINIKRDDDTLDQLLKY